MSNLNFGTYKNFIITKHMWNLLQEFNANKKFWNYMF